MIEDNKVNALHLDLQFPCGKTEIVDIKKDINLDEKGWEHKLHEEIVDVYSCFSNAQKECTLLVIHLHDNWKEKVIDEVVFEETFFYDEDGEVSEMQWDYHYKDGSFIEKELAKQRQLN
jgi:hypothetical protein